MAHFFVTVAIIVKGKTPVIGKVGVSSPSNNYFPSLIKYYVTDKMKKQYQKLLKEVRILEVKDVTEEEYLSADDMQFLRR